MAYQYASAGELGRAGAAKVASGTFVSLLRRMKTCRRSLDVAAIEE
jgi:hypothetical protein